MKLPWRACPCRVCRFLPAPEASGPFSLPELPVSVQLGALDVQRAEIGAPLLGEDAVLQITGSASLAGGEGAAELVVNRLDEGGAVRLKGGYENATRILVIRELGHRAVPKAGF